MVDVAIVNKLCGSVSLMISKTESYAPIEEAQMIMYEKFSY